MTSKQQIWPLLLVPMINIEIINFACNIFEIHVLRTSKMATVIGISLSVISSQDVSNNFLINN